jgi:hypothetical protein
VGPLGRKQEQYDFTKTCDLHYLLKHIIQPASTPVYASGSFPRRLHTLHFYSSRIVMRCAGGANVILSALCLLFNAAMPTPVILSFFQPFLTIFHKPMEMFNFMFRVQGAQG